MSSYLRKIRRNIAYANTGIRACPQPRKSTSRIPPYRPLSSRPWLNRMFPFSRRLRW